MHIVRRIVAEPALRNVSIVTIDPHPIPFQLWYRRTENCGMTHLRSPASHGIDPSFPTIRRFGTRRAKEFSPPLFIPPYHRPSLQLFNEHIRHEASLCDGHRSHVTGTVTTIDLGADILRIEGTAPTGAVFSENADAAILALGAPPAWIPPPFRQAIDDGAPIVHLYDAAFDRTRIARDTRVAVVGGGIGAVQLVLDLGRRGIDVTLWNRDPLVPSQFDSDPCYIGPRCGDSFRQIRDLRERRRIITAERRPGSVPADLLADLNRAVGRGTVRLRSGAITEAVPVPSREGTKQIQVALTGHAAANPGDEGTRREEITEPFDQVILATGFRSAPPATDLVASTARRNGLALDDDGYPIPDETLKWKRAEGPGGGVEHGRRTRFHRRDGGDSDHGESVPIYLTGALGELELGPPARNIIGAHLAGRRIVPDMIG